MRFAVVAVVVVTGLAMVGPNWGVWDLSPRGEEWQRELRWGGREFHDREEFARWLDARGATYAQWARRHPALVAELEARTGAAQASRRVTALLAGGAALAVLLVISALGATASAGPSRAAVMPRRRAFDATGGTLEAAVPGTSVADRLAAYTTSARDTRAVPSGEPGGGAPGVGRRRDVSPPRDVHHSARRDERADRGRLPAARRRAAGERGRVRSARRRLGTSVRHLAERWPPDRREGWLADSGLALALGAIVVVAVAYLLSL